MVTVPVTGDSLEPVEPSGWQGDSLADPSHPVVMVQQWCGRAYRENLAVIRWLCYGAAFLAYCTFLAFAIRHSVSESLPLIYTTVILAVIAVYIWLRNRFGSLIWTACCVPTTHFISRHWHCTKW